MCMNVIKGQKSSINNTQSSNATVFYGESKGVEEGVTEGR